MLKFAPPAGINDFDEDPSLYGTWDSAMSQIFHDLKHSGDQYQNYPAFYSPQSPPAGNPNGASPTWPALPKGLTARFGDDKAAELADKLIPWGTSPDDEGFSSTPFHDATGKVFANNGYRQQDEYLEWIVKRDGNNGITEIVFTCEGPEYWNVVASNKGLLTRLYQKYVSTSVTTEDLFFSENVSFIDPNDPTMTEQHFTPNDYNPYNKWNIAGAMHLTHPANTLGAEVTLAAQASAKFVMRGAAVATNPNLTCCQGIGEINRSSDPNIAATVNAAVLQGNYVTLANPVGLYMLDFDATAFTLPDGSPIATFVGTYLTKLRKSVDSSMTLRASLKVPDGVMFQGRQMLVSDLLCNRKAIQFGGQVAATITMGLFAQVIAGTPRQKAIECTGQGCPSPDNPAVIILTKAGADCTKIKKDNRHEFGLETIALDLRKPTSQSGARLRSRVNQSRG
jgi:hypothetical protein